MTGNSAEEHGQRAGRNEALFREVNERVRELNEAHEYSQHMLEWLCECTDAACIERIVMTGGEYSAVRENGTHFAITPSEHHVDTEVEVVVEQHDRYWVVEKKGEAGEVAEELDPRR